MGLGGRLRTQANETTFETSRTCRSLPAAWISSCGSHGSGTRNLAGGVAAYDAGAAEAHSSSPTI